jgi:hypothetical protein
MCDTVDTALAGSDYNSIPMSARDAVTNLHHTGMRAPLKAEVVRKHFGARPLGNEIGNGSILGHTSLYHLYRYRVNTYNALEGLTCGEKEH